MRVAHALRVRRPSPTLACMDTLSFVAKLVEVLAWPGALVTVVLLLRKELRQLVPLLRKIKAGPVEAEFEREIASLERAAPPAALPTPPVSATPRKLELFGLVREDPRTAILQSWLDVEAAALRAVEREALHVPEHDATSPTGAIRAVARDTSLSANWVATYYQLRELRDKAANQADFTPKVEPAAAYVELASRLQRQLEEVKRRAS